MSPKLTFARQGIFASRRSRSARAWISLAILLLSPALLRAQQAPTRAIGRIDGSDISVESGAAGSATTGSAASIFVVNGSVVTVHSGLARMVLAAGGEIGICGPAKFTMLESNGAITLALNFGRLHVRLPATTTLRIFTPAIIATPLDISGATRDINIGLDLNDSLCVLAATGALRLEQQFSGETLVVPQASEFFLADGKLIPVQGAPGSCQCAGLEADNAPPPAAPGTELSAKAESGPAPEPQPQPSRDSTHKMEIPPPSTPVRASSAKTEPGPAPEPHASNSAPNLAIPPPPAVEFRIFANLNDAHPSVSGSRNAAPAPPPVPVPEYKILLPPLVFSHNSPAPPPNPLAEMVLLIRVAHVEPVYEFTGRVEVPALDQPAPKTSASQPKPAKNPQKKKGGFLARFKRIFSGNS
jgi:hypothetical protein